MAAVYLAQNLKHDRSVAIKVLRGGLGSLFGPERFQAIVAGNAPLPPRVER